MKSTFRITALILALAATIGWGALGANRGWTKTSVPVKIVDEVTGIEGIQYRQQFMPGLDLLGATLLVAALLASTSLFFRNQPAQQNT